MLGLPSTHNMLTISSMLWLACALVHVVQCVPFYLYQGPAFDWLGNCSVEYKAELDARRKAMHGGEILFLEQIQRSSERVTEADVHLAQVFVVPTLLIFGACQHTCMRTHTGEQ